ncbi:MAG: hypothetical protein AAFY76_05445 [Cyanobacteria bacterium J06649_11]
MIILVFLPVNPDNCDECYGDFPKYANIINKLEHVEAIDLTQLEGDNLFYDGLHLNSNGAEVFAYELANRLHSLMESNGQ